MKPCDHHKLCGDCFSSEMVEGLERRIRILELKLEWERTWVVMGEGYGKDFADAMKKQQKAEKELKAMKLTPEEEAL